MERPGRSPDLTPMDFYLQGHLKVLDNAEKIQCQTHATIGTCNTITPDIIQHILDDSVSRLDLRIRNNGGHIEHNMSIKAFVVTSFIILPLILDLWDTLCYQQ